MQRHKRTRKHIQAISRACLRYVEQRLLEEGAAASQSDVGHELGVGQQMVSDIALGRKALCFDKIAGYAEREHIPLGKLLLELARLAAEPEGTCAVDQSHADWHALPDKVHEELADLEGSSSSVERSESEDHRAPYRRALSRVFSVFRESDVPVVAISLCFQGNRHREFLVTNQPLFNGRAKVVKLSDPEPLELRGLLEGRCPQADSGGAAGGADIVLRAQDMAPTSEAFWQRLMRDGGDLLDGTGLCVWPEPVFRALEAGGGEEGPYSATLLFVFQHGFSLPEPVRKAMSVLRLIIVAIHSGELERGAWLRPPTLLVDPARRRLESKSRRPASSGLFEDLCGRLCKELGARISRAEVWSFDYVCAEFLLLAECAVQRAGEGAETEAQEAGPSRGAREVSGTPGWAAPGWGPGSEDWRAMTGNVRDNGQPVVCGPPMWRRHGSPEQDEEKAQVVLGLRLSIRDPSNRRRVHHVVLYLWCVEDDWADMAPRVSAVVREFAELEIRGPAEPTESPPAEQQHMHRITMRRVFSEIDEGRRANSWRCWPEDHWRHTFQ